VICKKCADAADGKRKNHPKNCGCDCRHKPKGSYTK
jgi:hypothetical protein